jgi:hypothetical protein
MPEHRDRTTEDSAPNALPSAEAATADPPEAQQNQGNGHAEEDRQFVPLEQPVTGAGLVGQRISHMQLIDAPGAASRGRDTAISRSTMSAPTRV